MEMIDSYLTVGILSLFGLLSLISPDPNEQNVHNNTTYKVSIEHFFVFVRVSFQLFCRTPLICFGLNFTAPRAVIGREHREKIILSRDWFKMRACAYSTNISFEPGNRMINKNITKIGA